MLNSLHKTVRFAIIGSLIYACQPTKIEKKSISKIAFGSCAQQWLPQPIWSNIDSVRPDVFLFLGDAIYGDWDGEKVFEVSEKTLDRYAFF